MSKTVIAVLEKSLAQTREPALRQQIEETIARLRKVRRREGGRKTPRGEGGRRVRRGEGKRRIPPGEATRRVA